MPEQSEGSFLARPTFFTPGTGDGPSKQGYTAFAFRRKQKYSYQIHRKES